MSSGDGSRGGLNKQIVGEIEIPYLDSQSKNLSARTMANTLTLPEAQPVKKW